MKDIELPPLVGVLHALPDHIKTAIEAYGAACARTATGSDRAQRVPDWNAFEQAVQEYVEDYEMIGETEDGRDACYTPNENDKALLLDAFMGFDFSPWLLASTPAPAQQERKPMTDVEIEGMYWEANRWLCADPEDYKKIVRDTERHHGIRKD